MAKKANMYTADKTMAARVVDFMTKKVWNLELRRQRQAALDDLTIKRANLENLKGSVLDEGDKLDKMREQYDAQIADVRKKYEELLSTDGKFVYDENDLRLWKEYSTGGNVSKALTEWAAYWNLDIRATVLHDELVEAVKGDRVATARGIVNKGEWFRKGRSKNDVLGVVYGHVCQAMLKAHTIKAVQIPEELRAKYAPKSRKQNDK